MKNVFWSSFLVLSFAVLIYVYAIPDADHRAATPHVNGGATHYEAMNYTYKQSAEMTNYTKTEVKQVQDMLKNIGYYKGKIDGVAGAQTIEAIRQYQEDNELQVTGQINDETYFDMGLGNDKGSLYSE